MRENRETTMLVQGGLIWLLLVFGVLIAWLFFGVVFYFLLPGEISSIYRLCGATGLAAAVVAGAFFYFRKRF
ncbi:MAG: hypothetical protein M3384_13570 [Acidobacteriota bacterium]|nr:hypothetical protein [Acidobacteriota bacterium]